MSFVLNPHQVEGADFLEQTKRGILAWDVGTQKTHTAMEAARRHGGKVLLVCPVYLIPQWRKRIEEFFDAAGEVAAVFGSDAERSEAWTKLKDARFFLVGYEVFRMKYPLIEKVKWDYIIVDEAHRLRGRNSKWTTCMGGTGGRNGLAEIRRDLPFALLTGTAQIRDGGDWFPLLRICNPDRFGSYWNFVEEWCVMMPMPWGPDVKGIKPELTRTFREKVLDKYVRFRTLDETFVGDAAIPSAEHNLVDIQWSPSVRAEYYQLKEQLMKLTPDGPQYLTSGGALVTELRRTAAKEPNKLKMLKDIIQGHDEKVVVWTWHRDVNALVAEELRKAFKARGIRTATGDDALDQRIRNVNEFLATERGVLVAGLPALREGLDLQESSVSCFYEHDWVDATQEQALGRQRRPGQKKVVTAYSLVIPRSVDSTIYKLAQRRGQEADAVRVTIKDVIQGIQKEK